MHCRKKQRTHQPFNPSLEGPPGPSSIRWGLFEEIMYVTHALQPSQGKSKIEMRWLRRLSGGAFCLTNWILEKCIGDSQYSWVIASEILTAWITRGNERKQSDWKFYVQEISLKITQLQICSILHERGRMTQTVKLRAEPHTQRMEQRVQRAELWTTEDYSQGLKPNDFFLVGSQYFLQPVIFFCFCSILYLYFWTKMTINLILYLSHSCWNHILRVPWTARRSNQWILKEINPEYSLKGLMLELKLQYFGHILQRADSLEKTLMQGKIEGRRRRGWQKMIWLDGIIDSISGREFEQTLGDSEGQGSLVCCSPCGHRVRHDWVTEQLVFYFHRFTDRKILPQMNYTEIYDPNII